MKCYRKNGSDLAEDVRYLALGLALNEVLPKER